LPAVIIDILYNLNYWHAVFFLEKFNHFFEVRVALMLLLKPRASLVNLVDLFMIATMLLELFNVFLCPFKVFYKLIHSVLGHEVDWHSLEICNY
jgi:hypothetical protein